MDENEINEQVIIDDLFDLPATITDDPRLHRIYSYFTMKQMEEAAHLSVPHVAYTLIERQNHFYILMREKERQGARFVGTPADKALINAYLGTVQELNKMILAADIDRHKQLLNTINQIIQYTLQRQITDDELRTSVALQIALALEEAGVA